MIDYSLQRRWIIASALRAMRRMADDRNSPDIDKLRAAASLLLRIPMGSTSHD